MLFKIVSPTDKYKDNNIYCDIVHYCLNPRKTPHNLVVVYNLDIDEIADNMYALASQFNKLKGTRIRHMILSFDPQKEKHISYDAAKSVAIKSCKYYASDYQIFAVVHENKESLHIHIVMNTVRIHDGEKYKGRKKDFYAFQEHLKRAIKPLGLKLRVSSDS